MKTCWLAMSLFILLGLITACSAAGPLASGPGALSKATPITAATQVPGAPAGPFLADGQQSGDLMVWLSSSPAAPVEGNAQLDTYVSSRDGEPLTGAKVTYDTDMTNMSHGLHLVPADPAGDGHYVGRVHFSMPGPWRVITIIERPDHPVTRLRFEFRVKGQ
jgi:hypothetical protein